MDPILVTPREAGALIHKSHNTVRDMVKAGDLRGFTQDNGDMLVLVSSLRAWAEAQCDAFEAAGE